MSWFAILAASVFAVLGSLHLAYTVHDFVRSPRYFRPRDGELLASMRATRTAIAPDGRDYWSGVLGFHLSHSIGVLLFALLIVIAEAYAISWLRPVLVLVSLSFAAIAWRCWFHIPMFGALAATLLLGTWWLL